jgi:DNA-binding NarL/FixJ family response regulator
MQQKLTDAERDVVRLLVRTGGRDQELAEALFLSPKTISSHMEHVYDAARAFFGLQGINRAQLIGLLSLYMDSLEEINE